MILIAILGKSIYNKERSRDSRYGEIMRKVVITGLGAVTPCGNTAQETWQAVSQGKSGITRITLFDATDYNVKIAAQVKDFDITKYGVEKKDSRKMARFTQFLLAASIQAVQDSGYSKDDMQKLNAGIVAGNGIGGIEVMEGAFKKYFDSGSSRIPPMTSPMMIANEAAANVSMYFGIRGPAWTIATACASGTDALGCALDLIRSGRIDCCLAGGTEAAITGYGIGCFQALQALTSKFNDNPTKASRPFDKDRSGFVMAEGSSVLFLEEYEHARSRNAHIYAELAGFGTSSDAYHLTAPLPTGEGGSSAITASLKDAGVKPFEVDYYNAHGTSTHANDKSETKMIKLAFGEHAKNLKISSTKSMTGHMVGAAGATEALLCVKAIENSLIPPTINLDNPDIEGGCDLDYVPNVAQNKAINIAASASLGFGGHNACVIIKKLE